MAKKKIDAHSNGHGDGFNAFASAMMPVISPKTNVPQIYASAFEDAVAQINAALAPGVSVVATLRTRAAELNEMADLIEVTLAAKTNEATEEDDEDKKTEESPSNAKSSKVVAAKDSAKKDETAKDGAAKDGESKDDVGKKPEGDDAKSAETSPSGEGAG